MQKPSYFTQSLNCTYHLGSSNQLADCRVSLGAVGQSQSVGQQTEAVAAGDAQTQAGFQEHPGCRHLAAVLCLKHGERTA